jgi:predicted lipoprotein with Yx(FWY)xxD motif
MKVFALMLVLAAIAGCGSDDEPPAATASAPPAAEPTAAASVEPTAKPRPAKRGTRITARDSEFGTMLWGPKRRAIYIFQRDARDRSRCYGACAEAWPPVYTEGRPVAGRGVRKALLGTTRRRNGRRQVTYAGQPLYYYAHEGPGEVLCHNVNLNGGLWWVVGPDGDRRP